MINNNYCNRNQQREFKRSNPTPDKAPQQRSYLADLFKIPEDPAEYEEWHAELFGHKKKTPNGSISI